MRIEATQQNTTAKVTGTIRQAAKATGTSFQYLLATAKVESNLNPLIVSSSAARRSHPRSAICGRRPRPT